MIDEVMTEKNRKKNDLILIIALCIVAAIALFVYFSIQKDGAYAVVTYDGDEIARYQLDEDTVVLLSPGEQAVETESVDAAMKQTGNRDYNILVIQDGKADVVEANCRDKICVDTHEAQRTGETIVCLPHKTVVSIEEENKQKGNEVDF